MNVFDSMSTRRTPTPWGKEVKKRLLDQGIRQEDLVMMLRKLGCQIDKRVLSNLLYGIGISNRQPEIESISELLNIPYSNESQGHV